MKGNLVKWEIDKMEKLALLAAQSMGRIDWLDFHDR